jgi:hypothetical protein
VLQDKAAEAQAALQCKHINIVLIINMGLCGFTTQEMAAKEAAKAKQHMHHSLLAEFMEEAKTGTVPETTDTAAAAAQADTIL